MTETDEFFGKKRKNDQAISIFGLFFASPPWSPHDTNTWHWILYVKCCLFSWFHRETDRQVHGFGFVFFRLKQHKNTDQNQPTLGWKNELPTEAIFIFGSQPWLLVYYCILVVAVPLCTDTTAAAAVANVYCWCWCCCIRVHLLLLLLLLLLTSWDPCSRSYPRCLVIPFVSTKVALLQIQAACLQSVGTAVVAINRGKNRVGSIWMYKRPLCFGPG